MSVAPDHETQMMQTFLYHKHPAPGERILPKTRT